MAFALLQKPAAGGDAMGQFCVGECYVNGQEIGKNLILVPEVGRQEVPGGDV
jgi:hypothetical protein